MGFMVSFVSHKEDNKGGDHDIRSNEGPPIERCLERCESLYEQDEDIQKQIEAVDPDATEHLEGKGRRVNALLLESAADSQVCENDGGPGYVRR